MNQNELMHYGVLGMKWGVEKKKNHGSKTTIFQKNINTKTVNIRTHGKAYDKYLIKQAKRKERASGDFANLKYMNDAERNRYAKGRVKTMGSRARAIKSESTNFIENTAKTFIKGLGATSISSVTAGAVGLSVIEGTAKVLVTSMALGAIPVAAISVGVTAGTGIARGYRMGKNINAIKNVKEKNHYGVKRHDRAHE